MSTLTVVPHSRRSQADVSEVMRAISSKSTEPEKLFRKALWKAGIRSFRICQEDLPGKPDIVIPGRKLAIFIDGDFWHGNQYRTRGYQSLDDQLNGVRNSGYWRNKIASNIERDFRHTADLLDRGWKVVRLWESDIHRDLENCVRIVVEGRSKSRSAAFSALPRRSVAEFFAGIGLVRLGLDGCGWRTLFANDNDPQKTEMYECNFGPAGVNCQSIHDLEASDIPTCSLATASFPCNDLSLAGARKGLNGKHSSTFWSFIRLLKEMGKRRPPLVLLENVPGFLSSHDGKDFAAAVGALNELGYSCDPFIVDAVDFVPQSRARLFIIAKQGGSHRISNAVPTRNRPAALINFINEHPNLEWDLRILPETARMRVPLDQILEDLADQDSRWWGQERASYFLNQLSPRHLKIAQHMIAQEHFSYGTAFRRIRKGRSMAELRVDGIAGCLRTPRGGSGRQILFKAGKGKYFVRLLTPRECARLQGVPDQRYKIEVGDNQAFFGFGDAVCVPVLRWIAENYLNPLISEMMRGRVLG